MDGIEARFSDRHIALSVFAFDHDMIVTPHLSNQAGHNSPAFHIRRCQDDGVFDRFTALWDEGRGVWGANGTASGSRGHDQARRYLRARQ